MLGYELFTDFSIDFARKWNNNSIWSFFCVCCRNNCLWSNFSFCLGKKNEKWNKQTFIWFHNKFCLKYCVVLLRMRVQQTHTLMCDQLKHVSFSFWDLTIYNNATFTKSMAYCVKSSGKIWWKWHMVYKIERKNQTHKQTTATAWRQPSIYSTTNPFTIDFQSN